MKKYYCWRCEKTLPFLDEDEWRALIPVLKAGYRKVTEAKDDPAVEARQQRAVAKFKEIAGEGDVSFDSIDHHRLIDWGDECSGCGELLRTAQAMFCAHCGQVK